MTCEHPSADRITIFAPPHAVHGAQTAVAGWCAQCGAIQVSGEWRHPYLLASAVRDRDVMCATLTAAQEHGTKLIEENRVLRARLARFGG